MLMMVLVIFLRIYGQAGANTKIAYKCWCAWGGLLVLLLVNTHMCVAKHKLVCVVQQCHNMAPPQTQHQHL